MKFMIKILGWDKFIAEYEKHLAECRAEGGVPEAIVDAPPPESAPDWAQPEAPAPNIIASRVAAQPPKGPGITPVLVPVFMPGEEQYARWRLTNVRPQRQDGFVQVVTMVPLGDLTSEQMRVVAELAQSYGDGTIRLTPDQDLVLRWVKKTDLKELYRRLSAASLGLAEASTVADVLSCPGAECCRLAVTQSRGLGRLLEEHLRSRPDLIAAADGARIKISGCPNGCGQHHVATIGFQGSVRKVAGRAVPQYFVMVGGGTTAAGASFGRVVAKIPARRIPDALERLIDLYQRQREEGESAPAFFQRIDNKVATAVLDDLQRFNADDAAPMDYIDLAETTEFKPEVMEGECSA
jgi:sulfite reductase (NADPH) hemoprotein beta-component